MGCCYQIARWARASGWAWRFCICFGEKGEGESGVLFRGLGVEDGVESEGECGAVRLMGGWVFEGVREGGDE